MCFAASSYFLVVATTRQDEMVDADLTRCHLGALLCIRDCAEQAQPTGARHTAAHLPRSPATTPEWCLAF
jgi:hypothetical protein